MNRFHCRIFAPVTVLTLWGLSCNAIAYSIRGVFVRPGGQITTCDTISLDIVISTPSASSYRWNSIAAFLAGGNIDVDLYPAGYISTKTPTLVESVELGRLPAGRYEYEVKLHPRESFFRGIPPFSGSFGIVRPTPFVPGDADGDSDFDQFDLVKVSQGGKYLTGESATWGEGDWNGAPGASLGGPPPGDGVFDQFDLVAALEAGFYTKGLYAGQSSGSTGMTFVTTSVLNDARSDNVAAVVPSAADLTSIDSDSAAGQFASGSTENIGGSFVDQSPTNTIKATFGRSIGSSSCGNVAQPALTEEYVRNDLTVIAGGDALGNVDLVQIPEPSSAFLLAIGFVILALGCRHNNC